MLIPQFQHIYFCATVLKNLTYNKSFMELRYTEPHTDHRIAKVQRHFWRSLVQLPCSAQGQLEQVGDGSAFEDPQEWRLHFGQPVLVLDHPLDEKIFLISS